LQGVKLALGIVTLGESPNFEKIHKNKRLFMKKNKCKNCCVGLWLPPCEEWLVFEDDLDGVDEYFNYCPYCRS